MTHVVSHRSRTLLGACSVAAVMIFSQAGLAHGAGMGAMGGAGMHAGGAMMTPRATSLQPPTTTAPHPFDPSGHLPGLSNPSSSGVQPPVSSSPHPFDPSGLLPGVSSGLGGSGFVLCFFFSGLCFLV